MMIIKTPYLNSFFLFLRLAVLNHVLVVQVWYDEVVVQVLDQEEAKIVQVIYLYTFELESNR
jgi:hypothetical protein